jgi:hypothetical protein
MRRSLLIALIAILAFGIIWLQPGRGLPTFADKILAVNVPTPPVNKLAYDGDFRVGDLSLTSGTLNNNPFPLNLCTSASRMVVLKSGGRSFILGPRTNPIDPHGRPDIDFIPERGDQVTLSASRSILGWPTPFEFNLMAPSPLWKRYVYYRLVWKKRSGAELKMFWRYEQDYYRGRGWTQPMMMWDSHTGLVRVDINQRQDGVAG